MKHRRLAFTLIEILVVVAIIALLIAILMPSLARAKAMARMVQCQSNLRQLTQAFCIYAAETKGRLPGMYFDAGADWLGSTNTWPPHKGRMPEDGTIWKHMGRAKWAYICPDDGRDKPDFSYSSSVLLAGAQTEMLAGAHHPLNNFNSPNHTGSVARMKAFEGVPVLIEEDANYWLFTNDHEDGWCNDDRVSDRHLQVGGKGFGNIGFADGHVGKVQLPPGRPGVGPSDYFCSNNYCIRIKGGKWVSAANYWSPTTPTYGYLDHAPPASNPPASITH